MKHLVFAVLACAAPMAAAWAQPVAPEVIEGVALRLPGRAEVYRERHEIGTLVCEVLCDIARAGRGETPAKLEAGGSEPAEPVRSGIAQEL